MAPLSRSSITGDVLCFSHLRWAFVFQRPQHLMTRCARDARVFFIEEPIYTTLQQSTLEVRLKDGVHVVVPHLPEGLSTDEVVQKQRVLLKGLCRQFAVSRPLAWFYTPLSLPLVDDLDVSAVVYDCMDDLTGFAMASPELPKWENELFSRASVVFTGGHSLYEAKRAQHPNVHPVPSSVDVAHFSKARTQMLVPPDQRQLPRPRIGFAGVIDERMDLALLRDIAHAMPAWQFVMLGPIVKIDPSVVPRPVNIHYLGMKPYDDLPAYMSGWDVGILPFARNRATQFISPTKTPEYLAAGCPVVSTPIQDVVRPYGERGYVAIAATAREFVAAIAAALGPSGRRSVALSAKFINAMSWDATWSSMVRLLDDATVVRDPEWRRNVVRPSGGVTPIHA